MSTLAEVFLITRYNSFIYIIKITRIMKKNEFDFQPQLVTDEGGSVLISFDVEEVEKEFPAMDGGTPVKRKVYEAYTVRVEKPIERSKVIDAIITADYPIDRMQAVQNNYLLNPKDAESKTEFDTMQAWRAHAKEVATEVME